MKRLLLIDRWRALAGCWREYRAIVAESRARRDRDPQHWINMHDDLDEEAL